MTLKPDNPGIHKSESTLLATICNEYKFDIQMIYNLIFKDWFNESSYASSESTHYYITRIENFSKNDINDNHYKLFLHSKTTKTEESGGGQGINNYQSEKKNIGYIQIDVSELLPDGLCVCGCSLTDLIDKNIKKSQFDYLITRLIGVTKKIISINIDACTKNIIYDCNTFHQTISEKPKLDIYTYTHTNYNTYIRTPFYAFLIYLNTDISKYDQNGLPCFLQHLSVLLRRWRWTSDTNQIVYQKLTENFINENRHVEPIKKKYKSMKDLNK